MTNLELHCDGHMTHRNMLAKNSIMSLDVLIFFKQLGLNPVAVVQFSTHLHTNSTQNNTMKQNTTHT